jgi:hypothetical protein
MKGQPAGAFVERQLLVGGSLFGSGFVDAGHRESWRVRKSIRDLTECSKAFVKQGQSATHLC